jgi:hypothetical protein
MLVALEEGPMTGRTYVTQARLAQLQAALSERDWQLLADVARLKVLSGAQLQALHYRDSAAGRRLARLDLACLTQRCVLARLSRRVGGIRAGSSGFVYALDVAGQRLAHPGRRRYRQPWTPQEGQLRHALAVVDVYVALRQLEATGAAELLAFDTEPACWRRFVGPGGAPTILKPDAFVVMADQQDEHHSFLEVDLATESGPRITGKARIYVRYWQSGHEQATHGLFPQVVWSVPTEQRRTQLVEALTELAPDHWRLFTVATADETASVLTGQRTGVPVGGSS